MENRHRVQRMAVIRVLLKRKKTKKEVTKVFQYNFRLTVSGFFSPLISVNLLFFFNITEMIKVYDGNNSLRRRIFRVIPVPRQATTEQVLTLALRAFHITKDPSMHSCGKKNIYIINIRISLVKFTNRINVCIFFFFRKKFRQLLLN